MEMLPELGGPHLLPVLFIISRSFGESFLWLLPSSSSSLHQLCPPLLHSHDDRLGLELPCGVVLHMDKE